MRDHQWQERYEADLLRTGRCCCLAIVTAFMVGLATAQEPAKPAYSRWAINTSQPDDPEAKRLIDAVLSAQYGPKAQEAYMDLFEHVGSQGLRLLTVNDNAQIAVRASWQQVVLTIPEDESQRQSMPMPPEERKRRQFPEAKAVERFLGFLEGRLHIVLPLWWEQTFRTIKVCGTDGKVGPDFRYFAFQEPDLAVYSPAPDFSWVTSNCTISKSKGQIVFFIDGQPVSMPRAIRAEALKSGERWLSAAADDSRYYLIFHQGISPGPCRLHCLERTSGKLLWEAPVWAGGGGWGGGGGSGGWHFITITPKEDRLLVFGAGIECIYLEEFRCRDGRNVFRFSTRY
jgi:hypothetical protein